MRHRCEVCGKAVTFGHNVSHSNRKTNRRWLPNIQKAKLLVEGAYRTVHACTRSIRTAHKRGAV